MNYLYRDISLQITIGDNLRFDVCQSIRIESSVQVLTDTAKLELPREFRNAVDTVGKMMDISGKSILDFMKRGDSIKIDLGYDGDLETEFEGYISKIGAETPLLLECEDEMFQLKKAPRVTKFIKSGKLIDILKAVLPAKYTIECNGDYSIDKWLIDDNTPYEVLEELREKLGIRAYFKNPTTLVVGMIASVKPKTEAEKKAAEEKIKPHEFDFGKNIRRGSSLKFERKEDHIVEVIVESEQSNGQKLKYVTGQKGGNTIKKGMPGMTIEEMMEWAEWSLNSNYFDGFRGSFESWCEPRTKPGDAAQLVRPYYKDKHQDGRYFIESVTIDVNGSDGIKRTNNLSYKL